MKIAVLDDYQDAIRTLKCAARLKGHDVVTYRQQRGQDWLIA